MITWSDCIKKKVKMITWSDCIKKKVKITFGFDKVNIIDLAHPAHFKKKVKLKVKEEKTVLISFKF